MLSDRVGAWSHGSYPTTSLIASHIPLCTRCLSSSLALVPSSRVSSPPSLYALNLLPLLAHLFLHLGNERLPCLMRPVLIYQRMHVGYQCHDVLELLLLLL